MCRTNGRKQDSEKLFHLNGKFKQKRVLNTQTKNYLNSHFTASSVILNPTTITVTISPTLSLFRSIDLLKKIAPRQPLGILR